MSTSRIRIRYFSELFSILFLLFFMPASYVIGIQITTIVNYLRYIVLFFFIMLILYINRFGYKLNVIAITIILLYFWCLIGSTIINKFRGRSADFVSASNTFVTILLFVLICDVGLWYSPKKLLKSYLFVSITMCALNAITFFMYYNKGGMNHGAQIEYGRRLSQNYFLLGEDNATFFWSWPTLVLGWLYYYNYNSSRSFLFIISCYTSIIIASYVYVWSVMAIVASILVPLTIVYFSRSIKREIKRKKHRRHREIQFWYLWIVGMIVNIVVCMQFISNDLVNVIASIFRKDITISSRTFIWQRSFMYIANSPYYGYGYEPAVVTVNKIGINHTHNLFAETLYRGGIVGLLILVLLFFIITIRSRGGKTHILYKYLSVSVFIFLVCASVYFAYYRYHYLLLFLLYSHLQIFNKNNNSPLREA